MERSARASGSAFYSAPPGEHDDLVITMSLAVFRLHALRTASNSAPSQKFARIERRMDVADKDRGTRGARVNQITIHHRY